MFLANQNTQVTGQVVAQQANPAQQAVQTAVPTGGIVTSSQVQSNPQGLFTQEQVNSIIQGRVNTLNQKILDLQTQLTQSQGVSNQYLQELNGYKHKATLAKYKVPDLMQGYVEFEASKLAVNGKSFDDAVKEFVSANTNMLNVPIGVAQTQQVQTPLVPNVGQQTSVGFAQVTTPAQQTTSQYQAVGSTVPNTQVQGTSVQTAQAPNTVAQAFVGSTVPNTQVQGTNVQTQVQGTVPNMGVGQARAVDFNMGAGQAQAQTNTVYANTGVVGASGVTTLQMSDADYIKSRTKFS